MSEKDLTVTSLEINIRNRKRKRQTTIIPHETVSVYLSDTSINFVSHQANQTFNNRPPRRRHSYLCACVLLCFRDNVRLFDHCSQPRHPGIVCQTMFTHSSFFCFSFQMPILKTDGWLSHKKLCHTHTHTQKKTYLFSKNCATQNIEHCRLSTENT